MKLFNLNADAGESTRDRPRGDDASLIPFLSSVNLACGFHGGDPETLRAAIGLCVKHGVAIGAHPSYRDREGFGRRPLEVAPALLRAELEEQLTFLRELVRVEGGRVGHVKAHGALYHRVTGDAAIAGIFLAVTTAILPGAAVVGLAGSQRFLGEIRSRNVPALGEAFLDRGYRADGTLVPRGQAGDLLTDPAGVAARALGLAARGELAAEDGTLLAVEADLHTLHGDEPGAATRAQAVRRALDAAGVPFAGARKGASPS